MAVFNLKKCVLGFKYAFKGMVIAVSGQQNMWVHLMATIMVIIAGFFFDISTLEWIAVILVITLVIALEIANTAIEALVDWLSPEHNPKAGKIKDLAAAALLVAAIGAAITGVVIFLPKLLSLF